ncbi:MAG: cytochrome c family protein [Planctomycetes bacterium]|nr:cytochrome c family protein [Planctomycetota bacterium]
MPSLNGNIEPCGCGGNVAGGIDGVVALVQRERANSDGREAFVLVDGGNAVEGGPLASLTTRVLVEAWKAMRVDCVCLGPAEARQATTLLAEGLPLVSGSVEGESMRARSVSNGLWITSFIVEEVPAPGKSCDASAVLRFATEAVDAGGLPVMFVHSDPGGRTKLLRQLLATDYRYVMVEPNCHNSVELGVARYGMGYVFRPRGEGNQVLRLSIDMSKQEGWCSARFEDVHKTDEVPLADTLRQLVATCEVGVSDEESRRFVGSETCKKCHEASYKSWVETKHAVAFEALQKVGKHERADCVVCHVTGDVSLDQDGVVRLPDLTRRDLHNVGCESCHGPGREHVDQGVRIGTRPVEDCRRCHVDRFSKGFDPAKKLAEASCQKKRG